jgi:hypothetical protein
MKTKLFMLTLIAYVAIPVFSCKGEGIPVNGTFTSQCTGVEFTYPANWYVASGREISGLLNAGTETLNMNENISNALSQQMPGTVLFMISMYHPDSVPAEYNPNIIFIAINTRGSDMESSARALEDLSDGLKDGLEDVVVSEVQTVRFGNEPANKIDVTFSLQGYTICQRWCALERNDYLLVANMSAMNTAGLDRLMTLTKGIMFSEVDTQVDDCEECKTFRNATTLDIESEADTAGSSGGKFLRTVGIWLMIGGAFSLFKKIFG